MRPFQAKRQGLKNLYRKNGRGRRKPRSIVWRTQIDDILLEVTTAHTHLWPCNHSLNSSVSSMF